MSSFFSSGWCRRGAFSAAALVALALANPASAQPKTPAKPAARPAAPAPAPVPAPAPAQPAQNQPAQGGAPAPAAEASQVQQLKPEPAQPDWLKFCGNDPSTNQQICYTTRDFVSDQGQPALAVAVYDLTGKPEKIARFILPLGLLLTPGIRFNVDQSGPAEGKFVVCLPNGCFAEGQTTEAFINGMKKGTSLNVKFRNQGGEVTFQVPLAGFGKAFDGAPVDPKIVEEQQKKLQEELQKRSDELRSKLGGSAAASPDQAAPAAAPKP
ncbi:MAG TPA: invasion associated locus B family protein [Beijerinckiaceae bacterium]|jgi:invasion protein IalB|nr:invasion associated locus B family protein [Beijerinckiaceae bacterium]